MGGEKLRNCETGCGIVDLKRGGRLVTKQRHALFHLLRFLFGGQGGITATFVGHCSAWAFQLATYVRPWTCRGRKRRS